MGNILVVGSVAYDSVTTPFGVAEQALGGSATYFSVSASFFTQVLLVACVGSDFRPDDRELLEKHNVDLRGLQQVDGKTFRWAGKYGYDLNDAETLDTQLNVFADFNPEIPEEYRGADYVFLGNIDPALQRQVLSQVKTPQMVALDTMNYWIDRTLDSLKQTISLVHVVLINDAEARQLGGDANLVKAARRILSWGPRTLVIKRGEYGVLMFQQDGDDLLAFGVPGFPLEEVFDPTGAGDSFAGGFIGYLAGANRTDWDALKQAIIFGSVMASFNVEQFSLDRLKGLTYREISGRFREFKQLTRFEEPEQD